MNKLFVKCIGIVIGIIGGLSLVIPLLKDLLNHPVLIGMLVVGAGIYFYAKKVMK